MFYMVSTPRWLRALYPGCIWNMPKEGLRLYLTFDDGPHPAITSFVLDQLKRFDAKATFFCLGKNVGLYPETYDRILSEGHAVGNHTYSHMNGWNHSEKDYLRDISDASGLIHSRLFRPPYGRLRRGQLQSLRAAGYRPVMWNVLSGDFDNAIDGQICIRNVIRNAASGSVIVFHDSEKAWPRLEVALPELLEYYSGKGYSFEKIGQ